MTLDGDGAPRDPVQVGRLSRPVSLVAPGDAVEDHGQGDTHGAGQRVALARQSSGHAEDGGRVGAAAQEHANRARLLKGLGNRLREQATELFG